MLSITTDIKFKKEKLNSSDTDKHYSWGMYKLEICPQDTDAPTYLCWTQNQLYTPRCDCEFQAIKTPR